MYQVFYRNMGKWLPYSGTYKTRKEAENCLRKAIENQICDAHGLLVRFEVRFVGKPYAIR